MALNDPHLLVFMTLSHLLSSRAGWLPCLTKRILQKWWMIRWPWKTVTSVSGPQLAFPVFSQGCQLPYCELSKGEAYVATSVASNQQEPAKTAMWARLEVGPSPVEPWNDGSHCWCLDCSLVRGTEPEGTPGNHAWAPCPKKLGYSKCVLF